MTALSGRFWLRSIALGALLILTGCFPQEVTDRIYHVVLARDAQVEMIDGAMAEVDDCIERNNTDALAPDAAHVACAWAFSVPFAGLPPGVSAQLNLDLPIATVTVQNANSVILLTQICIHIEFDPQHYIPVVCGGALIGPMSRASVEIPMQAELDTAGVGPGFEINPENLSWEVLVVRYIRVLETIDER